MLREVVERLGREWDVIAAIDVSSLVNVQSNGKPPISLQSSTLVVAGKHFSTVALR
jgi:hypothetical protein